MSSTLFCPGCSEQSTETDYCSNCGRKLGGAAANGTALTGAAGLGGGPSVRSGRTAPPSARSARTDHTALSARSASVRGLVSTRATRSTRSSRRLGGAGIVPLPPLPALDPIARIIDGVVPERRRYCSGVLESAGPCTQKLSREFRFCPVCGTQYDFRASLKPGDVLDEKYEIKGPMAYGGLGWVYLAWDRDLSRWCVLKGLINSNDPTLEVDDGQGSTVEKLIDLGAVRRVDDRGGDLFATAGYSAPEINANPPAPTPVSDLCSVARALALLVCDFAYQDGPYEFALPTPDTAPVFAAHESLYRFLTRATAEAPDARFQTADEMAQQLLGVLREEIAGTSDAAELGAYQSTVFESDATFGGDLWTDEGRGIRTLPALKLDPLDAGASTILACASILDAERRLQAYTLSLATLPQSSELLLRIADLLIECGHLADAEERIAQLEQRSPFDWRAAWYRGKSLLSAHKPREALRQFDVVLGELPGELAPKLAVGLGYELADDDPTAIVYYESVSRTDPLCTAAAFGLARAHLALGDRAGAVAALETVAAASVGFVQAQLAVAGVLAGDNQHPPTIDELRHAGAVIDGLKGLIDGLPVHRVAADFFNVAARVFEHNGHAATRPTDQLLGVAPEPGRLRSAAERELRLCARYANDRQTRVAYVNRANRVRPRTLW
jgi:tetratricopeptide (TPR) repeat protein